ncbi:GAF domain-containing sensor histidine kinase [Shouchella lonarensis]|uniref:histidine kinase n=1 Tax=Shouchella lonarensis TaxID=1464122 RepID=A0A1G6H206_9BACI|nr:GAF domain-containing sensor histidine kinase [Shouchella lonarensis]SDB87426.1 two-component system, NarL family, sensor kinase [Shouchella lonarensis]
MHTLHTLKQISQTLNQETDRKTMLARVLTHLLHETGLQSGWIFLITKDGAHELAAAHGLPPALAKCDCAPLRDGGCACKSKFLQGSLASAVNMIECQRIERVQSQPNKGVDGITHHATIPIYTGDEKLGILNVAHPHKIHYNEEELQLLELIALQIGTALKRISLVEEEAARAWIYERHRLARDLHDSVNQLVFSMQLTAQGLALRVTDEAIQGKLQELTALAQAALKQLKTIVYALRDETIRHDFMTAVTTYGQQIGMNISWKNTATPSLSETQAINLYRIAQEVLNNTKKHSGATGVRMHFEHEHHRYLFHLHDDGCGFDEKTAPSRSSYGLQTIRERTQALSGQATLVTAPGRGTTWRISFPKLKGEVKNHEAHLS